MHFLYFLWIFSEVSFIFLKILTHLIHFSFFVKQQDTFLNKFDINYLL